MNNKGIIRNRKKIEATINNARIFKDIQSRWGSFDKYIWHYTNNKVVENDWVFKTHSEISDTISKDLQKMGMKFVGTTIIYSYMQAIGIVNDHEKDCEWRNINE